jgi:catechol 2,3-dioxygenase-like lactoylglutathione lyase family enzyme
VLTEGNVFATIAVKNLDVAKQFYGVTLGLTQVDENPGGVTYQSGTGKLFIYQAPTAGTNQATSAAWEVQDVEGTVEALKGKGIQFEKYDIPGATQEGDVSVMGPMKAAWFKDPDGNILSIGNAA